ncbi:MAG: glycosyltransferase [Myxococcota bacterium]|nr:glycosyltransferase [Myxococcota bacterium]
MPPKVTVIVPVLDGAAHIGRCLEALRSQSYPAEQVEILVVDNGSVDETRGRVRDHGVRLLVERSARSPYMARNAGLEQAKGEVLAFTDSDCVPAKDWLERGVARIEAGADLVGGHVRFSFGGPPSAAQILDAITNLDQEASVRERGAAKTGNLLVHGRVIADLGGFAADRRSGGDVEFTTRATGLGFELVYAAEAVVEKPARGAFALAKKQYRVGRGQLLHWLERGETRGRITRALLRSLLPVHPRYIAERLAARGPEGSRRLVRVWLTSWWIGLVQSAGRLHEWIAGAPRR